MDTKSAGIGGAANGSSARDDVDLAHLCEQPYERQFGIEQLNMSVEGQAAQVEFTGQMLEVHREPNEFGPSAQALLSVMRSAFFGGMAIVQRHGARHIAESIPADTIRIAAEALIGLVDEYQDVVSLIQ